MNVIGGKKNQITDHFYEIHFRSKLKLNDCLTGTRGVYELSVRHFSHGRDRKS